MPSSQDGPRSTNRFDNQSRTFCETPSGKVATRVCFDPDDPATAVVYRELQDPEQFNLVVTTTPQDVPATAGNVIWEMLIENLFTNDKGDVLEFSLDGGATYHKLEKRGNFFSEENGAITQVKLRSNEASGIDAQVTIKRLA